MSGRIKQQYIREVILCITYYFLKTSNKNQCKVQSDNKGFRRRSQYLGMEQLSHM